MTIPAKDEARARGVLEHACRGLTFSPDTTGAVPWGVALRAMLSYASEREKEAIEPAAKVTDADVAMCRELAAWWDSGRLSGTLLRDHAAAMLAAGKADEMNAVRQAERDVVNRVIRAVAAIRRLSQEGGE